MNLNVNLGKQNNGVDFSLDFEKQQIYLTLLVGATGTGKSVLGYHIYRQLVEQNSSDEITFVLIDNTHIEFTQWNQKSPYLYCPNILDPDQALEVLESLANKIEEINTGTKHYFIHIEESDLFYKDSQRSEKILKELLRHKKDSKIHVIFSTSRPATDIITPWLLALTDLKIIYQMASVSDYMTLIGQDYSKSFTDGNYGEKLVFWDGKANFLLPLTSQEVSLAQDFKL